ncbi:hypothetical protein SAMN05216480_104124 [Pustulibacterium marinum]|uniref:Viral A-type inclusion protein n=1 Tax=Pustulibacterium marinum TaxID=1224947 RepID=A0A1I7GDQ9_9FLAO|nr:hypothetical protein [Pustulibacterium marinum]SFU46461.1 hypothetical protein SAMN05216480_104124 [Pustulibacterium marinum]
MKKIVFLLIAAFGLLFTSCEEKENPKKAEFKQLLDQTMEVHDALMAEMGTMNDLRKSLKTPADSTQVAAYEKADAELKNAHMQMMKWMNDFNEEFPYSKDRLEGKTAAEIEDAIEKMKIQKKNVENLETNMKSSIENAKEVLGK